MKGLLKVGLVAGIAAGLALAYADLWTVGIGAWHLDPAASLVRVGSVSTAYAAVGALVGVLIGLGLGGIKAIVGRKWDSSAAHRLSTWVPVAAAGLMLMSIHVRGGSRFEPGELGFAALPALALLGTAAWLCMCQHRPPSPSKALGVFIGTLAGWALYHTLRRITGHSARPLTFVSAATGAGFLAVGAAAGYTAFRSVTALVGLANRRLRERTAAYVVVGLLAMPLLVLSGIGVLRTGTERAEGRASTAIRPRAGAGGRPNVLLISVDTLRADFVGYAGGPVKTPNIDRVAATSYVFDNAYSVAPWTRPSFAAFFSGRYPSEMGVGRVLGRELFGTEVMPYEWREDRPLLAELFRAAGYFTGAISTNPHLTPEAHTDQGFEAFVISGAAERGEYRESEPEMPTFDAAARFANQLFGCAFAVARKPPSRPVPARSDDVARLAEDLVGRMPRGPVLLWLHYMDPHYPYDPPSIPREARIVVDHVPVMSGVCGHAAPERQKLLDAHTAEIEFWDRGFGTLVDDLKAAGLWDTSIIVFWSDHGEEFWEHGDWEHGQSLHNELLHVPLIIHLPAQTEGRRIRDYVSLLDVMPTLLDLCDIGAPADLHGRSLKPLLTMSPSQTIRPFRIYLEGPYRGAIRKGLMTSHYKLVYNAYQGTFALYDLRSDPEEQHNIHGMPGAPDTEAMEAELRHWCEEMLDAMAPYKRARPEPMSVTTRQQLKDLGYVR
jgi:arylsulfatase A-like enzyme